MSYRWLETDSNESVYQGDRIILKSTTSFTATLPADPIVGAAISFLDGVGSCGTNNTTIARNGKKIVGLDEDLTVGTGGSGGAKNSNGVAGNNTTFGSLFTALAGGAGLNSGVGGNGGGRILFGAGGGVNTVGGDSEGSSWPSIGGSGYCVVYWIG